MSKAKKEITESTVTVGPSEAMKVIKHLMGVKRPVMLWGPPGIGKSDIVREIGQSFKVVDEDGNVKVPARPVIDLRLLLHDPTDLKGMPYYDFNEGRMKWSQPSELPRVVVKDEIDECKEKLKMASDVIDVIKAQPQVDVNKFRETDLEVQALKSRLKMLLDNFALQNAILFFDELVAAPQSVQGAAYQLVLDRKIGEYELPAGVDIIAAGNRETDRGVAYKMPKPLQNRFIHFSLDVKFEDWQLWAIKNGVKADVVGFLSQHTHHLFNFDPRSASNAFPTPRSWKFLSDALSDEFTDEGFYPIAAGTVGDGVALEFLAHRKVAKHLPRPMDILNGTVKEKLKVKEISAIFSLVISLCYKLNETLEIAKNNESGRPSPIKLTMAEWNGYAENFFMYMLDNFSPEMCVLGARTALKTYGIKTDFSKMKSFRTFYEKYGHLVIGD